MELSIILISHNQSWNIPRLIESVLHETTFVQEREILLVDSASSDGTAELAATFPIRVLRLPASQRLTAAAGRYVGCKHTSGKLVLFLDGDMEMMPGWLACAMDYLARNPAVAAVTGQVFDVLPTADSDDVPVMPAVASAAAVSIPACGGAGMYRRAVLEQVGNFNPYLYSEEEPDLCLRMRVAGYSIVRLERPLAKHYSDMSEKFATVLGRWRRNLHLGQGQNLRYKWGTRYFWRYMYERSYGTVPAFTMLVGIFSLAWWLAAGQARYFQLWLAVVAVVLVADAIRKRSLYRTLVGLFKRWVVIVGTVHGLLIPPFDPANYPCTAEVVLPPSVAEEPGKHAYEERR